MAVQRLSNSGRSGFSYKSLIAGITPLPSVPTIGAATAVNFESVNVAFTAPGAYAGSTYTATSSPGGLIGTSATSPILVSGLSELTQYTFTVTATNATGTSGASAASSPVTTPAGDTGVMFPLGMVQVGSGGTSSITFSSIPQTYKHLQIRAIATTPGVDGIYENATFNGDTGSNYSWHLLIGRPDLTPTAISQGGTSQTHIRLFVWGGGPYGAGTTGYPAVGVADILDYTNTSKYKTTRGLGGGDSNSTVSNVGLASGSWRNTNAITSITLTAFSAGNASTFGQHSQFALYGIKG